MKTSLAVCSLLCGLAACGSTTRRIADADYPGVLRAPGALGTDVLWQQRVTACWGEGEQRGFDAAVQAQGDVLTVLGLSPVGAVGFSIRWDGHAVQFQNDSGMEMPFSPRFVLLDVQRVFLPWLPAGGVADGARSGEVDGERVTERWVGGRLQERRFERLDGRPAGSITVTYRWGEGAELAPVYAELRNDWFGYRMLVDTFREVRLPPPPAAGEAGR